MKTRREKKEERYDLLSMMLNCEGLTDQEVKSNTFIFFIAGHETVIISHSILLFVDGHSTSLGNLSFGTKSTCTAKGL